MKTTIEQAVRDLLNELRAPLGAVNVAAVYEAGKKPFIRVWVATNAHIAHVPRRYHGFKVVEEDRPIATAW